MYDFQQLDATSEHKDVSNTQYMVQNMSEKMQQHFSWQNQTHWKVYHKEEVGGGLYLSWIYLGICQHIGTGVVDRETGFWTLISNPQSS